MFTKVDDRGYGLFFQQQTPWAAGLVLVIAVPVVALAFSFKDPATPSPKGGDLIPLAASLFTDYSFPFEIASVLLLAALVGAIVLVKRDEP